METIRLNPIPAALIGIGIGWLIASARQNNTVKGVAYDGTYNGDMYNRPLTDTTGIAAGERVKDTLHSAGDNVSQFAADAKNKVGDIASDAKHKAGDIADAAKDKAADLATTASGIASTAKDKVGDLTGTAQAKATEIATVARDKATELANATRETTQNTVSSVDRWVHDEPLMTGAIALLVGVAVGLAVPGTTQENQIFGAKRDELAKQATDAAQDVVGKVQTVAGNVIDTAGKALGTATEQIKTEVKDQVNNQGLAVPA